MSENTPTDTPDETVPTDVTRENVADDTPRENVSDDAPRENVADDTPRENDSADVPRDNVADDTPRENDAADVPREYATVAALRAQISRDTPLDEATLNTFMQGLGSDSAKTRKATILKYEQNGISDERLNRVLRELAQSDPEKSVRVAAGNALRKQVTGQFVPANTEPPKTRNTSPNNKLMYMLIVGIVLLALCIASALVFTDITNPEIFKPTPDAQEIAVRQTADTIVLENAQAIVTLTALARPQNTETSIPQQTEIARPAATQTAQPIATETPRPIATENARPSDTASAQPITTETPRPIATETARPSDTATAQPIATETPRPIATETARTIFTIGETIRAGNWEYRINRVQQAKTLSWGTSGDKAQAKGTFLLVYMTVKNIGSKNSALDASNYQLKDANGNTYNPNNSSQVASFIRSSKMANFGEQIPPGPAQNALLIFDLDSNATGLTLFLNQAQAQVKLEP